MILDPLGRTHSQGLMSVDLAGGEETNTLPNTMHTTKDPTHRGL